MVDAKEALVTVRVFLLCLITLVFSQSLGEALDYLENKAKTLLPSEARISFAGQSKEYKDSSSSLYITFLIAMLTVFLVLAAQFESFRRPLAIIFTVPIALTAGLYTIFFTGTSINVYS